MIFYAAVTFGFQFCFNISAAKVLFTYYIRIRYRYAKNSLFYLRKFLLTHKTRHLRQSKHKTKGITPIRSNTFYIYN